MKLFYFGKDGGPDSTVWGFWPIEAKGLFSVALLCFENGSREAFHSHAFNSVSWVLTGGLTEMVLEGPELTYKPYFKPVWTPRSRFHKVASEGRSWVLTFRGPWKDTWQEYLPKLRKYVRLSSGRRIIPGA